MPTMARMPNVSCATASFATISWSWRRVACCCGMAQRTSRSTIRAPTRRQNGGHHAPTIRQGNIEGNDVGWIASSLHSPTDENVINLAEAHCSMVGALPSPICVRGDILQACARLGYQERGRTTNRREPSADEENSWQPNPMRRRKRKGCRRKRVSRPRPIARCSIYRTLPSRSSSAPPRSAATSPNGPRATTSPVALPSWTTSSSAG